MILRTLTWGKEPIYYIQKSYRNENGKPATKNIERLGTLDDLKARFGDADPIGMGVVERILNDLVRFLNDDERFPVDPLMKMAMAHYQFEAIHPFRDGNGRTGRIICLLYLIQKGLLDMPILYLSAYILQNKDRYYFDLSSVTGTQNWKDSVFSQNPRSERSSYGSTLS